ncbi:aldo/keto reductase [Staphylococcus gallinarum]|uniref:aldo/keto reductase n=1 Tax=Staphylococcus TaxID=1279 RepID=UPI000D1E9CFD|nr:aldo/keto reductase [Staphylococcus gallinarum]MCD8820501.1 aldo/keto reductase [Staphylococcus gallinarum]PTL06463.1 2,5-diketo-D-gluconic acid reductase [Staphylococcus gallinarum]PTL08412.1 2,5-diketo-D-gluconic acid reductase [Staphylococcus gallinarum]RIL34037.1 aldo/keto reductase [Staphylococcus gallinarum]RIO75361.1 aldo/keto reductase [Staphylococcus gallinarum]
MEYLTLNNGVEMPKLGLGVFRVTNLQEAEQTVVQAIEAGYRLIDTAAAYGNEEAVGRAIQQSKVAREELFITSKLWLTDNSYEGAKRGLERSLKKLNLDYIDLYLIHQPIGDVYGAWRYLEEAYQEGKIRAIGVDDFTQQKLVEFITFNEVKPAINMVEANVFHQRVEDHNLMKEYDVQMEAWAPFANGGNNVFELPELIKLSEKYNKSVAQIILRWFMQRDIIAIPKTVNVKRMQENIDIFDFELSAEDMDLIATLNSGEGFKLPEDGHAFKKTLDMLNQFTV